MILVTGINTELVPQFDASVAQTRAIWQYAATTPPAITPITPESLRDHISPTNFRTGDKIEGLSGSRGLGIFENFGVATWAWEHRKGLMIGGGILALLGLGRVLRLF